MSNPRRSNGFTLIEIMLALLVVTIGVVAVVGLLSSSLDSASKTHEDLNVVCFADLVLNYCHAVEDFADLPTTGSLSLPGHDTEDVILRLGAQDVFTATLPLSQLTLLSEPQEYTVTYQLDIAADGAHIKTVSLQVWPGYETAGTPRRFYTEIYNWKKGL
ncbi:prepilin-type N-terminal cleavage/methylation domain-containing protein [Pontiella sp.]|uniref:prepilin-type N-terminal cleavage/methylation domain-containing protein n=1 Tax=Pontiella sp. TaxID=2837462 RepID=UPI0035659419